MLDWQDSMLLPSHLFLPLPDYPYLSLSNSTSTFIPTSSHTTSNKPSLTLALALALAIALPLALPLVSTSV